MGKPDWMKKKPKPAKKEEPAAATVGGPKVGGPTVAQTPATPPARPAPAPDTEAVSAPNLGAVVKQEVPAPPAEQTHTVVAGDNLSVISRKYYGTADHWRKIYEANKDIIKDPNTIRVGQVLTIPSLE